MSTATLPTERSAITYTPALCAHLEDLRRSYAVALGLCHHHLEECAAAQDEDGVKIAQLDLTLTSMALTKVNDHLSMANREWTR